MGAMQSLAITMVLLFCVFSVILLNFEIERNGINQGNVEVHFVRFANLRTRGECKNSWCNSWPRCANFFYLLASFSLLRAAADLQSLQNEFQICFR